MKLADLGLAKIVADMDATVAYTSAGVALGTPSYMSPEQFDDASQVDLRADIFSLGATLYHMLRATCRSKDVTLSDLEASAGGGPRPAPADGARLREDARRQDDGQAAGGSLPDLPRVDRSTQQGAAAARGGDLDLDAKPHQADSLHDHSRRQARRPDDPAAAPTENRASPGRRRAKRFRPKRALAVPEGTWWSRSSTSLPAGSPT